MEWSGPTVLLTPAQTGTQTGTPPECVSKGRLALDPLGLGIDVREADFNVLRPIGDQAPTEQIQAALAGLGIIADGWNDDRRSCPLQGPSVSRRDHRPRRVAVFPLPARAAHGGGVTGG